MNNGERPMLGVLSSQENILVGQASNMALEFMLRQTPEGAYIDRDKFRAQMLETVPVFIDIIESVKRQHCAKRDERLMKIVDAATAPKDEQRPTFRFV